MIANIYTTKGPTRAMNQDGLFLRGQTFADTPEPITIAFSEDSGLYAVIDGMGGPGGGELATSVILAGLKIFSDRRVDRRDLETGLLEIQSMVRAKATAFPHMGAALAGIWRGKERNLVFNCGDCRVYRSRSGFLEKLTHDHSVVQELVDAGQITEDEARFHPRKNLMTSAISADDPDPQIFCAELEIGPGDQFLMCSDGLWECLSLEELEERMAEPPERAAKSLADAIWEKRARDNVSFIILTQD
ncbi:MAG: hypothetical protein HDQ93_03370 [Desulfovibrio sp.]|nr:hypothetical protein [Desulfovibrio sp.]